MVLDYLQLRRRFVIADEVSGAEGYWWGISSV
jgi:hypothetical protein